MGFDDETLEPTYLLRTGAPGKSAGLDVARRLGLPLNLIQRAHQAMSTSERDIALFLNQPAPEAGTYFPARGQPSSRIKPAWWKKKRHSLKNGKRRKPLSLPKSSAAEIWRLGNLIERADAAIEDIRRLSSQKKTESQARRKVARAKREFQEEPGRRYQLTIGIGGAPWQDHRRRNGPSPWSSETRACCAHAEK